MSRVSITNLWIWVVLAFLLLISAWTALIFVSVENTPELIPLEHQPYAPEAENKAGEHIENGGY
jgi:hypothetical protein